ncbi:MAG: hypothetical protein ACOC40_02750, partial [Thermoplasmatota archaeon]
KIVAAGTTKSGEYNEHDHWILYATITIYDYDAGTNSLTRELQHYYYESDDLTEIFGMDIGDVTGDGNDNIITCGNYYEYDELADVAEIRLWTYDTDTTEMVLEDRVEYDAEGHSTVLSVLYRDSNNDFSHEITGAGFFHDGDYDKGFNVSLVYNGTSLQKLYQNTWEYDGRPIRDGETDAMSLYENSDGLMEIMTTGRIGLSAPVTSFYRLVEIGGITFSQGDEETDFKPLEDVRYRTTTGTTLDRVDITISSGTEYSYYTFSRYLAEDDNIELQWTEEVNESVTVDYEVDVGVSDKTKILYKKVDGVWTFQETLVSDGDGLISFSTTDHSTNELMVSDPVETKEATNIGIKEATLNGESYEDGDVYFEYRNIDLEEEWISTTPVTQDAGTFSETIDSLELDSNYEFKAMLDDGTDVYEGLVKSFSTEPIGELVFSNFTRAALENDIDSAPDEINVVEHSDFPGDDNFPQDGPFTVAIWGKEETAPQLDSDRVLAILLHKEGNTYYVLDWAIEGTNDNTFTAGDNISVVTTAKTLQGLGLTA